MGIETRPSAGDPGDYVDNLDSPTRRRDAETLLGIYADVTDTEPVMWGPSIIGYGTYHYTYDSGHEGDYFKGGFAPRKAKMVLYLMGGYVKGEDGHAGLLAQLGPHKTGASCLYLGSFDKIDLDVLTRIIADDWKWMTEVYG